MITVGTAARCPDLFRDAGNLKAMFLATKPSTDRIQRFIDEQSELPFSYREVGKTRGDSPPGYFINHHCIELGKGEELFNSAVRALHQWKMYDLGWTILCWSHLPIIEGTVTATLVGHYGFWSLNACRIVYALREETDAAVREGFAIGTLPDHAEQGEERFSIEWNRQRNTVSYDIYAFARPKHILARIASPLARSLQRRFARESLQAMLLAVSSNRERKTT